MDHNQERERERTATKNLQQPPPSDQLNKEGKNKNTRVELYWEVEEDTNLLMSLARSCIGEQRVYVSGTCNRVIKSGNSKPKVRVWVCGRTFIK